MYLRAAFLVTIVVTGAFARRLPIQVFTTAQGLPRNSVECLVPGPTGLLWICTSEGLVRFDGYRFRVFGTADGLPSQNVLHFAPSRKGGSWVVTDKGVCRLAADAKIGAPCRLLPVDRMSGGFINNSVLESVTGETWVATSNALFGVSPGDQGLKRAALSLPPNDTIQALADGWEGSLLVATNFGVYEWRPGEPPRNLAEPVGFVGPIQLPRVFSDEIWLPFEKGAYRLRREGAHRPIRLQLIPGGQLTTFVRKRDGSIWAAGYKVIERLEVDGSGEIHAVEQYGPAEGVPALGILLLTEDSAGNLWGATDGSGIFRIADSGFVSYSTIDGLGTARVASIFEYCSGRGGVETSWDHGPEVLIQDGGRFRAVRIAHPSTVRYFGWGWNQYLVASRTGEWWISIGSGLLRFPKLARTEDLATSKAEFFGAKSALGCADVFRVTKDSAGDVWITCLDPRVLVRWERDRGQFHRWTSAEGWPERAVATVIREKSPGVLWIGTSNAAVRFRGGRFEFFRLPSQQDQPVVRDLLIDQSGRVWLSTYHAGVFRCDNPDDATPVFRQYTIGQGLSTSTTSSLTEDGAGLIYVGTARGVDRIDPRAPIESRRIRHFTAADGLPDSEENTAFRDRHGHLWFGSLEGLAEFDPTKAGVRPPPEIYVMRVRVRGVDVPLPWEGTRSLSLDLAADRNQIEIEYAGLDLRAPDSLRYQYRLGGEDGDWSDPVEQRIVNYASLPRGSRQFEVRAVDPEGQISTRAASIQIAVQAPVWLRWWFLSSVAVLATGVITTLYQYRVRQLLAIERLRTRIATDLHDDMGASLSQISVLSEAGP